MSRLPHGSKHGAEQGDERNGRPFRIGAAKPCPPAQSVESSILGDSIETGAVGDDEAPNPDEDIAGAKTLGSQVTCASEAAAGCVAIQGQV